MDRLEESLIPIRMKRAFQRI